MSSSVLINGKWEAEPKTTGVQRYATELRHGLDEIGFHYDLLKPTSGGRLRRMLWEQRRLAAECSAYDTLFCPANMGPLNTPSRVRLVLTLHCLRFLRFPDSYRGAFLAWYRFMIPRLLDRADVVLTVSNTVAEEITEEFPVSKNKLRVVYPAAAPAFSERRDTPRPHHADDERPGTPMWVFMGNTTDAKNLPVLIAALGHTRREHNIMLIGVDQEGASGLGVSPGDNRIKPVGHVNHAPDLADHLRSATGLLAPSKYESFGLPVLEALACGTPVIASGIAAHREVAGDAAVFADPRDPCAWAEAMDRLADDHDERAARADAGLERSREFDWTRSATEVAGILSKQSTTTSRGRA